ncbi:unnamed protein product [Durusdinium trenchii]|uniref:Nucleotide-diphospho-sugar transferase domain-containing protein n=1 Tax=Durusdinium trenchii TaxID=1381693 RepID=A0ABP0QXM9_9DINO
MFYVWIWIWSPTHSTRNLNHVEPMIYLAGPGAASELANPPDCLKCCTCLKERRAEEVAVEQERSLPEEDERVVQAAVQTEDATVQGVDCDEAQREGWALRLNDLETQLALSATRELDRMAQVEAKLRTVVGAKNEVIDELKDELGRREQEILEANGASWCDSQREESAARGVRAALCGLNATTPNESEREERKKTTCDRILRAEVPSDGAVTLAVTAPRAAPEASGSRHQGLAIVADDGFRVRYQLQIQSLRCYARAQGYDFWLLQGSEFPECQPYSSVEDFFFQKHCAIANLLEQQEDRYALAVLDADVVAVDLDRSLDMWMGSQGDLQFYKRITGEEVMAGNYIARNRPWVRQFLRNWASFKWRRPPGFSSADNGALHVALMEALERPEATRVAELYGNLTAMVEDLTPYWHFVEEAMVYLTARHWHMEDTKLGHLCGRPCVLSIWPRMSFFVDDGVYLNRHGSSIGPVMHHGIKDPQDLPRYFADLDACRANRGADGAWVSPEQLGQEALRLAEGYRDLYQQGFCEQCAQHCVASFTCAPLG